MLLTAVLRSMTLNAGGLEPILLSYPLSKLFLDIMDGRSILRARVNAADPEEWDYVNPSEQIKSCGTMVWPNILD
jgi:hypothetical protein